MLFFSIILLEFKLDIAVLCGVKVHITDSVHDHIVIDLIYPYLRLSLIHLFFRSHAR